jgi:hypothetical protein
MNRECCAYCMWYGPVNQDGTMRKHRPSRDDGTVGGRKVQDLTKGPCEGSRKPFAQLGGPTLPQCETRMLRLSRGQMVRCSKPAGHDKAHVS